MHSLPGKVALVTGGASGIGAGVCRHFVDAGAFVVVADVDEERGRSLAEELGDAAVFRRVDVTREEDIAAAVTDTAATRGRLDCLVDNAGRVGSWRFAEDISAEEWDEAFRLLCRSVFLGIKHASRIMCDHGGGSIVNTGGVAGLRAGYGPHPYGAAKAAVVQLTRSSAVELAPHGIRVNAMTPGGVATRIVGHGADLTGSAPDDSVERVRESLRDFQPVPRSGEPQDLAAVAAFPRLRRVEFPHRTGNRRRRRPVAGQDLAPGDPGTRKESVVPDHHMSVGGAMPATRHTAPARPSPGFPGTARTTVLSAPAPHKEEHNVSTPDAKPPAKDPWDLPDVSGLVVGVLGGTGPQGKGLAH
ncbi:SDR family NAD(P)-dependent oxidoreductase, partial [Streptomyces sp. NPDC050388]|uniref:SDR family NAD(P)-dependent oxidoreductase n=1 Tax=Streptomyces sp. NPDC050388 TaxID=3155781 RepID=UPI003446EA7C